MWKLKPVPRVNKGNRTRSIAFDLIGVLMIGLVVPMTVGMLISMADEKAELESELETFHRESLTLLADNIEDSLISFSPEEVKNTAGILLKDDRVVTVEVFSNVFDLHLVRVSKQTSSSRFSTRTLTQTVSLDNEVLGHVRIDVDNDWIGPLLDKKIIRSLLLFSAMFAGGLLLTLPVIYYKILIPLKKLTGQAKTLSSGDLDRACPWKGKDEMSMLGNTLDEMRRRLKQNFDLMEELAVTDELTGLVNRRGFTMAMDKLHSISARYGHDYCIAVLDLDRFKSINDTHGHGTGDEVLKIFSDIISRRIRKSDLFARIGGEEFALVLPQTGLKTGQVFLNNIRKAVCRIDYPHKESLTVSIGVSDNSGSKSVDQILAIADKALYMAKNQGRNRVIAL